jgi:hypothetical protein
MPEARVLLVGVAAGPKLSKRDIAGLDPATLASSTDATASRNRPEACVMSAGPITRMAMIGCGGQRFDGIMTP